MLTLLNCFGGGAAGMAKGSVMAGLSTKTTFVLALIIAASTAGCATSGHNARIATYGAPRADSETQYTSADRIFRDGYADVLRTDSRIAPDATNAQILAAYEGVDGARLAHRLYGEARAEELDGACEPYVKIVKGETLYDIAKYCDVPVSMLIDQNPVVHNPRHVKAGQIIEVPQIFNAERHALAANSPSGVVFASWYVVQPGDTLDDIAAHHLVSAASIAMLNPNVNLANLPAGAQLRIPAADQEITATAPVVAAALPSAYGAASGTGATTMDKALTEVMPYAAKPAHVDHEPAVPKSLLLTVDRRTVKPGGKVVVSAVGLPANTSISLYSGANGAELDFVKTVTTDSHGTFSEPVTVKGSSNIGGVIFRAIIDSSGKQLQSPRVGVDKIKATN